jgi:hypothetical protein
VRDMSFDSDYYGTDSSLFSRMSGKRLALLVFLIAMAAFFVVQAMFGFPIKDLFRSVVTEADKVIIKNELQNTCVIEGAEHQPRIILDCPYKKGDTVIVTFRTGTAEILSHHLK